MKTLELKTNIMCGSCIAKATPSLNEAIGEGSWRVDTQSPKKILSVTSDKLSEEEVIKAVEKSGYKAEKLS
ncbi:heavy-metal-associated domain-containing protein [Rufibacter sp. LB8]|uniref:heavy-metal-associated domain-containing protein n=1 Tax=Rufibacter sp. LB8 TaxID=2777781 RepID=UPI00178C4BB1|nr:heavy-metal-associated domain-containing protein [Rufibacter sp. LB8]